MSLYARLGVKRNHGWIGYKVHLTETCDDDQPHLIVHAETTAATTPDWGMAEPIHDALAQKNCLPSRHVVDGGYVDADALVTSRHKHQVDLFGPVPLENSWQAKADNGFDLLHFQIDWQSQTVRCPAGQQNRSWTVTKDRFGQEVIYVRFAAADCLLCSSRGQCTQTQARSLTFRPQARYFGLPKTKLQHIITATAIKVLRIVSWRISPSLRPTPISRFAALALQYSKPAA
jgi:transposase